MESKIEEKKEEGGIDCNLVFSSYSAEFKHKLI